MGAPGLEGSSELGHGDVAGSTVARETFRAGEDLNALDPARYAYQHSSQGLLYAVRSQFATRLIHPARVAVQARSKAVAIRLTSAPR